MKAKLASFSNIARLYHNTVFMSTAEIWETYRLQLFNYIKRQVHDAHIAKDILQEVFIKAETKRHEVKDAKKMGGWMFSITRNAIVDYFRKNDREKRFLENLEQSEILPDAVYNACVSRCLNQLIYTLPQPYQEALIKTEIEGVPQNALASMLGISFNSTYINLQNHILVWSNQ